jgi:hypothetical protein
MMDDFDFGCAGVALVTLAAVAFLLYCSTAAVIGVRADRACKERGWPSADVTYNLTAYCVKRINQTDSVVALSQLQRGK